MSLNIQQGILFTVLWASDAFSLHALDVFLDRVKKGRVFMIRSKDVIISRKCEEGVQILD